MVPKEDGTATLWAVGLPTGVVRGKGAARGAEGVLRNVEMSNNYLLLFNYELKPKFKKSHQKVWLQKEISARYHSLWGVVQKLLVASPTPYLVEHGFSVVMELLSEQRNRLQITQRGDLKLLLSDIKPDIGKLVSLHRARPSH
jgi:hypothetical protein